MWSASALVAPLLLLVTAACVMSAPEERPLVCRIEEDSALFSGQTVVLEGRLFTDYHHGSLITHDDCLETSISLQGEFSQARGGREFFEAWRVGRGCPDDPLYLTVVGAIETVEGDTDVALRVTDYRDVRHAPGSTCPLTYEELERRGY